MRRCVPMVVVAWAAACNSRGTFTLTFDVTAAETACGGSGSGSGSGSGNAPDGNFVAVVYAKPSLHCDACACGACFGSGTDTIAACDGACPLDGQALDVDLDLPPGDSAVVFELFSGSDLVAEECYDASLSTDGRDDGSGIGSGSGGASGGGVCCPAVADLTARRSR